MAPVQPSLGPPRDEPRVFEPDKFNGDNFAECSFKMENIFDHCDLLEVMEGTEMRPENDPEKSPWVRKSAQGYLLLGQALGSSQIRHIKQFQRELEKGPKAWAALKGGHSPAIAAVAVVLEQQMAALRIEEDEAVEEGVQKFFDLLTRLEEADLNYSELQKKTKLLALIIESWSLLIINLNRDLPHLSLEDVKRAIFQEDFRRREFASTDGAEAASIGPSPFLAHFGQYKTAQSSYDAVVARYSSPATAALSRLMLPYLFPDFAAFATVADLVAHLRTSDARYRAALPTKDHFLSLCPTELIVDLLEERLATAEKSILAVSASRGNRRTPFFEGCYTVPLLPSVASVAAIDLVGIEEVGAASAPNARCRKSKGKGSKGGGGGGGGGAGGGGGGGGVAKEVGVVLGVGASVVAVEVVEAAAVVVEAAAAVVEAAAAVVEEAAEVVRGGFGGSQRQQQPRSRENPSAQELREWYAGRGRSGGAGPCTY
ncbi:unnamed protein product, partial [Closterium sp. NIES-54]